nr:hypothetical protein KPHV_77940 [Kitasatospora purpeofusca]
MGDVILDGDRLAVVGASINLQVEHQQNGIKLPSSGAAGDLLMIHETTRLGREIIAEETSLWLCIGTSIGLILDPPSQWCRIPLGDPVDGTA